MRQPYGLKRQDETYSAEGQLVELDIEGAAV